MWEISALIFYTLCNCVIGHKQTMEYANYTLSMQEYTIVVCHDAGKCTIACQWESRGQRTEHMFVYNTQAHYTCALCKYFLSVNYVDALEYTEPV